MKFLKWFIIIVVIVIGLVFLFKGQALSRSEQTASVFDFWGLLSREEEQVTNRLEGRLMKIDLEKVKELYATKKSEKVLSITDVTSDTTNTELKTAPGNTIGSFQYVTCYDTSNWSSWIDLGSGWINTNVGWDHMSYIGWFLASDDYDIMCINWGEVGAI